MNRTAEELVALVRSEEAARQTADARGDLEDARRRARRVREVQQDLWWRLEPHVRRLAWGFRYWVRGAGLTEDDLVQLAYLRLCQALPRFDPNRGTPLRAWLSRVLTNYYIQLGRRREARRSDAAAQAGAADLRPEDRALSGLCVRETLDRLLPADPRRDQKVMAFWQYWVEGYTLSELATQARVSVTTLWKWLAEVRAAFSAAWGPAAARPPGGVNPRGRRAA